MIEPKEVKTKYCFEIAAGIGQDNNVSAAGDYIATFTHIIAQIRSRNYIEPTIKIYSNIEVRHNAEDGNHFDSITGITEYQRVMALPFVISWDVIRGFSKIRAVFETPFVEMEFVTGLLEMNERRLDHVLDIEYPHECFGCKKTLHFRELMDANREIKREQLEKLWKSAYVELYCCSCYQKRRKEEQRVPVLSTPYRSVFLDHLAVYTGRNARYVMGNLRDGIRPGEVVYAAPDSMEPLCEEGPMGVIISPARDALDALEHAIIGFDPAIGYEAARDMLTYGTGLIVEEYQGIISNNIKSNNFRRLIKKCVKKVPFWGRLRKLLLILSPRLLKLLEKD